MFLYSFYIFQIVVSDADSVICVNSQQEAELIDRMNASQLRAKDAVDLAAAKEAELQLARQQLQAEEAKGLPVEQDIQRHRKMVSEKVPPKIRSHGSPCERICPCEYILYGLPWSERVCALRGCLQCNPFLSALLCL